MPRTLLIDVLRTGLRLSVIGGVVGLTVAWLLTDALPLRFFNTGPHDAFTFISVPVVLLLTATLACSVPARRASRLDPIEALRD